MAKELEMMRITPASNGGITAEHEYKRKPVFRKGGMSGGMDTERPPSESFAFGPEDGQKFAAHISKHLGLKMRSEPRGDVPEDAKPELGEE